MTGVRLTIWMLCLVFVAAGLTAGQQDEPLTPVTAALRLSSNLEKDSFEYPRTTRAIASSYWRRGDFESAFARVETLEPKEQAEELHYFAVLAIKSGQNEQARSVLNRALKLIMSEPEDSLYSDFVRGFASLSIEVDDLELAAKFTDALDEGPTWKARTLSTMAEAHAKRGEKDKAVALLDQAIEQADSLDGDERGALISLLATSVRLFVVLGEKDLAAKLANRANEFLLSRQEQDHDDNREVAISFARLGEFSRAKSLLESLDDEAKAKGLVSLAYEYQARGDETAALSSLLQSRAILESSSADDYSRSMALNRLAMGYLGVGKPDEAFEVMRGIRNGFYLVESATEVAASFAAKGRRHDASAALNFAYSQIRKVVSEKSEDIPGFASTSRAKEKSHGLSRLGEKYLEIGDLRGAEAAAKAIDQPQYKASLFASVAVAYFKEWDQSKAKSLLATAFKLSSKSERYNHDSPREPALLKIAEGYADAGLKQESADVVLRFLREIRDGDNNESIEWLIEIGLMAEKKGVPTNKSIQKVLKQVVKNEEDN